MATKDTKPAVEAAVNAKAPSAPSPAKAAVIAVDDTAEEGADMDSAPSKADTIKMKDFLAAIVAKTGAKKKDAKEVVDATLAEIARSLAAGKALSLPPLGNLRVAKTMEKGGAPMLVLRLRMGGGEGGKGAKQALAEDGEDS